MSSFKQIIEEEPLFLQPFHQSLRAHPSRVSYAKLLSVFNGFPKPFYNRDGLNSSFRLLAKTVVMQLNKECQEKGAVVKGIFEAFEQIIVKKYAQFEQNLQKIVQGFLESQTRTCNSKDKVIVNLESALTETSAQLNSRWKTSYLLIKDNRILRRHKHKLLRQNHALIKSLRESQEELVLLKRQNEAHHLIIQHETNPDIYADYLDSMRAIKRFQKTIASFPKFYRAQLKSQLINIQNQQIKKLSAKIEYTLRSITDNDCVFDQSNGLDDIQNIVCKYVLHASTQTDPIQLFQSDLPKAMMNRRVRRDAQRKPITNNIKSIVRNVSKCTLISNILQFNKFPYTNVFDSFRNKKKEALKLTICNSLQLGIQGKLTILRFIMNVYEIAIRPDSHALLKPKQHRLKKTKTNLDLTGTMEYSRNTFMQSQRLSKPFERIQTQPQNQLLPPSLIFQIFQQNVITNHTNVNINTNANNKNGKNNTRINNKNISSTVVGTKANKSLPFKKQGGLKSVSRFAKDKNTANSLTKGALLNPLIPSSSQSPTFTKFAKSKLNTQNESESINIFGLQSQNIGLNDLNNQFSRSEFPINTTTQRNLTSRQGTTSRQFTRRHRGTDSFDLKTKQGSALTAKRITQKLTRLINLRIQDAINASSLIEFMQKTDKSAYQVLSAYRKTMCCQVTDPYTRAYGILISSWLPQCYITQMYKLYVRILQACPQPSLNQSSAISLITDLLKSFYPQEKIPGLLAGLKCLQTQKINYNECFLIVQYFIRRSLVSGTYAFLTEIAGQLSYSLTRDNIRQLLALLKCPLQYQVHNYKLKYYAQNSMKAYQLYFYGLKNNCQQLLNLPVAIDTHFRTEIGEYFPTQSQQFIEKYKHKSFPWLNQAYQESLYKHINYGYPLNNTLIKLVHLISFRKLIDPIQYIPKSLLLIQKHYWIQQLKNTNKNIPIKANFPMPLPASRRLSILR